MPPLDATLFQHIAAAGPHMWRDLRRRLVARLMVLLPVALAGFHGLLWLVGHAWAADSHRETLVVAGWILVSGVALLAAFALAILDALRALVVAGPFLRSLGDLVLRHAPPPAAADLASQFGGLASPHGLARLARIRDLPLVTLVARSVLGIDAAPLLRAAVTGLGREALVREVERQARERAAATIRRLRAVVAVAMACAMGLLVFAGWLLR